MLDIFADVNHLDRQTTDGQPASRARLLELVEGAVLAEGPGKLVDLPAEATELSVVDLVQEGLGQLFVGLGDKRYREGLGQCWFFISNIGLGSICDAVSHEDVTAYLSVANDVAASVPLTAFVLLDQCWFSRELFVFRLIWLIMLTTN